MDRGRWRELMDNDDLSLTSEEMDEGWHWCLDWDQLLVGPGMEELNHCGCPYQRRKRDAQDQSPRD